MSTVVTENLKRSSETASRSLRGVAAAWVNFDGSAGTISPRGSQNVSSLTDLGAGQYQVNFSNATGDTFSSVCVGGDNYHTASTVISTSTHSLAKFNINNVAADAASVFAATFGDLA